MHEERKRERERESERITLDSIRLEPSERAVCAQRESGKKQWPVHLRYCYSVENLFLTIDGQITCWYVELREKERERS